MNPALVIAVDQPS